MTADHENRSEPRPAPGHAKSSILQLPALIAISLYMLLLASVIVFGVASGHYPPIFLIFSAGFIAASAGLMRLFRWAWALTLAAVVLLAGYNLWIVFATHPHRAAMAQLVQGLLNMVFFLYLVRTEVRDKLT